MSRLLHEAVLQGYVHETARQAIAENALAFAAEQRHVIVAFAKIEGLELSLQAIGRAGVLFMVRWRIVNDPNQDEKSSSSSS